MIGGDDERSEGRRGWLPGEDQLELACGHEPFKVAQ